MQIDYQQLEFWDSKLRLLIGWLEASTGISFTITSTYRINDKGVHGALPLRGVDVRCRNKELGKFLESYINRNWTYDHKRPSMKCALFHDIGRGAHLHLQVHPNTIRN